MPCAYVFGTERTIDSIESFSDAMRFAKRTLAAKDPILCAWRAETPEMLQFVREFFAQIMRDLDAGRLLIRIRTQFRLHQELQ